MNINSRIINKHDTEANWLNAADFVPKIGEIVIYDADTTTPYARVKIGDGTTPINDLPFADIRDTALYKTPQTLTDAEVEQVRINTKAAGENVAGQSFDINGTATTAGENAEIFNDYENNIAAGKYSHAEGYQTIAKGSYSHVEGYGTFANGAAAHAEGYDTKATARYAHAEGASTTASGNNSHAEGNSTTSSGHYSHAEGNFTTAAGGYSHAEGNYAQTGEDGTYAHAEGSNTKALKTGAHAEGNYTEANAVFAHTEGYYTKAGSPYQHVRGKYNIVDENNTYSTIIGNGDADSNRKNIHTLDWDGGAWFSGDVYVGSTGGLNKDEGSKKLATEEYVSNLYMKLNSNTVLGFYCIEDVTIITNGVSKVYPANSNVEITFIEGDQFEIVPTSNNSILALNAFPGALGTYYPWLEGVRQFSNILFDMNTEDMYTKWNQNNQGLYQVQFAQYTNCIFWSDIPYEHEITKRTNYTLYYSSQLPLCYSNVPDNTFRAFFLAFGVNSDPNWGNPAYRESFAKATWPTQVFSYYGARTIGIFGHDNSDFNITLPTDCRGLMYAATAVENAGTFDAINVTNFGAKSGSWREAFGWCTSLRHLYIKNLKVNLNISWSPINYDSIQSIISAAANTGAITISVSPYTYYLLQDSDFELAASKNITIELLTTNYAEDKRLSAIANKADKDYVDNQIANLVNSAPETLDTLGELATAFNENQEVVEALNSAITSKADAADVLLKTEQTLTDAELTQVRENLKFIGKDVSGQSFTINDETVVASQNAEIFGDYENNIATGQWSIAEGSNTIAKGRVAHAEGAFTQALNDGCHTEGYQTIATGYWSHAEGEMTRVTSYASHAEGSYTTMPDGTTRYSTAAGYASHTEGGGCHTNGVASHAEGIGTTANGRCAHVEGTYTVASGKAQHVEGIANIEDTEDQYIHIAGNGVDPSDRSNAHTLDWDGNAWFAGDIYIGSTSGTNKDEGSKKVATEEYVDNKSAAAITQSDWQENDDTSAAFIKNRTHWIEESSVEAISEININNDYIDLMDVPLFEVLSPNCTCQITIDGVTYETTAIHNTYNAYEWYIIGNGDMIGESGGDPDLPFGLFIDRYDENYGEVSEGTTFKMNIVAKNIHKIPEIYLPEKIGISGTGAYSEIFNNITENTASADYAHAENFKTTASGYASHAEGMNTVSDGYGSHAEGNGSQATAPYSHAEGWVTLASGNASHAAGIGTIAAGEGQTVLGKYNVSDTTSLLIIGNGTSDAARSNLLKVSDVGNLYTIGDIFVGVDEKKLATEEYVLANFVSANDEIFIDGGTAADVI